MQRLNQPLTPVICLLVSVAAGAQDRAPESATAAPRAETTSSQDSNTTTNKRRRKETLDFFRDRLRDHRLAFRDRPDEPFHFVQEPLIAFDNPVSRIHDGFMFLWTQRGRPVAVVKSYYNEPQEKWGRTFVSLATHPIEMQIGERKAWFPRDAGLSFAPLKDAPAPAERPRLRLVQMRKIAERFQVIDNWGLRDPMDWKLRLLPTPLYRYKVPEETVIDGAQFGYVLTTSPEALVLIEARKTDDGLEWHYAVSRCTRFGLRFSLDDRQLAKFPRLDAWPATGTYFHMAELMPQYPFKRDDK